MVKIFIFGDSIVLGRGVNKDLCWPSLLTSYYDKVNYKDIFVYNLGIPGETSTGLAKRIDQECRSRSNKDDQLHDNYVIIATGLNDSKRNRRQNNPLTSPQQFRRNIIKIIAIAQKYSSNKINVLSCTPVDEESTNSGRPAFNNSNIDAYNDIIKKACRASGACYISIHRNWRRFFFGNDGIHPNADGHKKIYKDLTSNFKINYFEPFSILQKMLNLSTKDICALKKNLIEYNLFNNELFMGQFYYGEPHVVIGAPCIRYDISGITLNTFYQIFMPLKVASFYKIPAVIILGTYEEILLNSTLKIDVESLERQLSAAINDIATSLNVQSTIVNTSTNKYKQIINRSITNLGLTLSRNVSSNLYNMSCKPKSSQNHLPKRIAINKRVIACSTSHVLNSISHKDSNFLVVEDIEQYKCVRFANKLNNSTKTNFLAFLPLPNIYNNKTMFKSESDSKILLKQSNRYYKQVFSKIKPEAMMAYSKFFNLYNNIEKRNEMSYFDFQKTIGKISKYF